MPPRELTATERERLQDGTRLPRPNAGWRTEQARGGFYVLVRDYSTGLRGLFSIDPFASWSDSEDGWWRHLSLSRPDKHPKWDEMRDLVYSCGYFDAMRSVRMVLPPKDEYFGELGEGFRHFDKNPNVFHWWQLV